jgi:hypothetical protein
MVGEKAGGSSKSEEVLLWLISCIEGSGEGA